jgi:hypothetical protein
MDGIFPQNNHFNSPLAIIAENQESFLPMKVVFEIQIAESIEDSPLPLALSEIDLTTLSMMRYCQY